MKKIPKDLRKHLSDLGRKGGAKTSLAKKLATHESLKKARAKRWEGHVKKSDIVDASNGGVRK